MNALATLERAPEAPRQVAVADRIVVTKTDLAPEQAVAALHDRLETMNPYAARVEAVNGELDPELLRSIGPRSARAHLDEVSRWLAPSGSPDVTGSSDVTGKGAYLGKAARAVHDPSIRSFVLWFDKPFTWDSFNAAVQALTSLRGPDLLRVKGLINVEGERGPVVVQGAQHVFHPPVTLEAWSSDERRSRLVFITRNLERDAVASLFAAVGALA